MTKKCLALLLILACCFSTAACASEGAEVKRYEASFLDVFDTYSQIVVYTADKDFAQSVAELIHGELLAYHKLYDIYNDYEGVNNLKTVNDNAGVAPVQVDQRLIKLVSFAKEMYTLTNGRMNVAMGSVLKIWHDHREAGIDNPENATLPNMTDLQAAAEHTDITKVVIDEAASTLYLEDPDMRLDVGAVAKGYATEQVAQALIEKGVTSCLLSIGGNVRAIGTRADGTPWRVGVQNPDLNAENQNLTKLDLADLSLVSSGSYQRYYTVGGKQYHHIIDPDTLMPADYFWAVSIITQDSGLADSLSTALYTLSLEDGQALIASLDNTEALWVLQDGTVERSEGFASMGKEVAE